MSELPSRIKQLGISVGDEGLVADLVRESGYTLAYRRDDPRQPAVSLLLPPSRLIHADGDLFPSMDMNLPEGYLFQRLVEMFPKAPPTKMHLLALMGRNGIGRVGYHLEGAAAAAPHAIRREDLLHHRLGPALFDDLVRAYLSTGVGISGVQPKIMVPTRSFTPIPDLIVKTEGPDFPDLSVNEYLCLTAAREAGLSVPGFELSDDGRVLVLDRFDLRPDGGRLGFEDMAALMGLRVHDRLSTRKYHGSYEAITEAIRLFGTSPAEDLRRFYEQLALSIMVRNGDAHLKNFGMLHDDRSVWLSPVFDVVTTTMYPLERPGGVLTEDRTLALKLRRGRSSSKAYPTTEELLDFGRRHCEVRQPTEVIERIAQGMSAALRFAATDDRMPAAFLDRLREQWSRGLAHATGSRA